MKQRLIFILILVLSMVASIGISSAQTTTAVGTVTAWSLNVRTTPTVNAPRIGTLSQGYTAGVIGKNNDSTWYQIILEGGSGWVSGQYLSVTNAHTVPVTYTTTPSTPQQPVTAGGLVNTGALNIRTVPSPVNNVPIMYVLRHTPLTIFARTGDNEWYKVVTSNNVQGWVRGKYVNVTSGNINNLPIEGGTPQPQPVVTQGYVNTWALNVRAVPSPFNNIPITFILRGTTVNIVGRSSDSQWYQVDVNNTIGWVRGRYITITNGNIASLPVVG